MISAQNAIALIALREAAGEVVSDLGLVWVEGPDAATFLQGILSQDLDGMLPGKVARSFLLSPQGKLEALLWIVRGENVVGILSDAEPQDIADRLNYYRIRVKAEIRIDDRPRAEVWGLNAVSMFGLEEDSWVERQEATLIPLPWPIPRVVIVGMAQTLGLPKVEPEVAEAVRIEIGEPRSGIDVDQSTIPQESGLADAAVSFTKGCFLGQELVARIDTRGRVNRHLRRVSLDEPVAAGAVVSNGERTLGTLTSTTKLTEPPMGLGLLRREAEPGADVVVAGPIGPVRGKVLGPFSLPESGPWPAVR